MYVSLNKDNSDEDVKNDEFVYDDDYDGDDDDDDVVEYAGGVEHDGSINWGRQNKQAI